ncbi:MAG: Flp family type IVb pilin [Planctomycetota bacterium]|jgi:Flp pilus assembly pilin Flp
MQSFFKTLWTDESGQDTTEYVLLVAILATNINEAFSAAGGELDVQTSGFGS